MITPFHKQLVGIVLEHQDDDWVQSETMITEIEQAVLDLIGEDEEHRFTCVMTQFNSAICDCGAEGYNLRGQKMRAALKGDYK